MNKKEPLPRVYSSEAEYTSGFCPICSEIVNITLNDNPKELFGFCSECGNILFYSKKLSIKEIVKINNLDIIIDDF